MSPTEDGKQPLTIDHALHGYADGHRLLACSTKLSRESQRTALVLSDVSGPTMTPGFETHFTGYPLPDDRLFALGKTWHAPEMARVGCVWTHTLLLSNAAIEVVQDVFGLLDLFQQPSAKSDFGDCFAPLALPSHATRSPILRSDQQQPARSVLTALYSTRQPVFFVGEDARVSD